MAKTAFKRVIPSHGIHDKLRVLRVVKLYMGISKGLLVRGNFDLTICYT